MGNMFAKLFLGGGEIILLFAPLLFLLLFIMFLPVHTYPVGRGQDSSIADNRAGADVYHTECKHIRCG